MTYLPRPDAVGQAGDIDAEIILEECVVEEVALYTYDIYLGIA